MTPNPQAQRPDIDTLEAAANNDATRSIIAWIRHLEATHPAPQRGGDHPARTAINLIIGTAQGAADGLRHFHGANGNKESIQTFQEIEELAQKALAALPEPRLGMGPEAEK